MEEKSLQIRSGMQTATYIALLPYYSDGYDEYDLVRHSSVAKETDCAILKILNCRRKG